MLQQQKKNTATNQPNEIYQNENHRKNQQ